MKTLIELAEEYGAEKYKTPPLLITTPDKLEAYSRALLAPYIEALEAVQRIETISDKAMANILIDKCLAAHREMFRGE